ncbi:uncharacterized protein LOC109010280 [Juglans regia]|uniref:Uncharacterized protein LOC109010280 n=1 Tax=Juglans regia TaxID=51240 RepID=A0A6P9EGR6_JUGRE|nr:uncharacterized protein LOC109010280 [Juglans regia]
MDKSWMRIINRFRSAEYREGVYQFITMAHVHATTNNIRCPCRTCHNNFFHPIDLVERHLFTIGIDENYTEWIFHGEEESWDANEFDDDVNEVQRDEYVDDMDEMLDDIRLGSFPNVEPIEPGTSEGPTYEEPRPKNFDQLLEDARRPLYPGCANFSKLSFIVKLLHIRTIGGWTVKSFDMLLKLLKDSFPDALLPDSYRESRRMEPALGFGYMKIDVCPNDCILYWKENADKHDCPKCGMSRWVTPTTKQKKIPHKVLRYFPLKPRLKRLFMSKKTAVSMRWHKEHRVEDSNVMRHPRDSVGWKEFDQEHISFASDARNVRLGLASDGFNPFNNMSKPSSVWPVILVPYNLPPWLCMKDHFFMMSLLIPGPKAPGNEIDVYLWPLIDELVDLWENGVDTYDASTKQMFQLHAALLWTINDFPAYGNLSGWSTKGKLACPTCNGDTDSLWLKYGRKHCYMGHRRFLSPEHSWRRKKTNFNGNNDHRMPPCELSGHDVLDQLNNVGDILFGKGGRKRKRRPDELNWTKTSIFFQLPYWSTLKLRHNLDVMHIEKNICDNVLGTLMSIPGKTKDSVNARKDLMILGIKKELHLQEHGQRLVMPPACYTLQGDERKGFFEWLQAVKFPDGFAGNITRCVTLNGCKISGMKSHDCHIFLQRLLPVAIAGYLRPDIRLALTELSIFFRQLCTRTLSIDVLNRLEIDIPIILCKLEMILPPAFFDVMMHLAIHLPREALYGGPVQYRWMYPFERYLGKFKHYVRNKARAKGSIAEAYIHTECLSFCSMYLHDVETRFDREERNVDVCEGRQQCEFSIFTQKIRQLRNSSPEEVSDDLYALACGPDPWVSSYTGCIMNGTRFHTAQREEHRLTQNSGVLVPGDHQGRPIEYYGVLMDIIVLNYLGWRHVYLFKCDWFDVCDMRRGVRVGNHFTSVDSTRKSYKEEPFVLACQASQVFYLKDTSLGRNWLVVQKVTTRNVYDIPSTTVGDEDEDHLIEDEAYQDEEFSPPAHFVMEDDTCLDMPLHRNDIDPILVDDIVILDHPDPRVEEDEFLSNYSSEDDSDWNSDNTADSSGEDGHSDHENLL